MVPGPPQVDRVGFSLTLVVIVERVMDILPVDQCRAPAGVTKTGESTLSVFSNYYPPNEYSVSNEIYSEVYTVVRINVIRGGVNFQTCTIHAARINIAKARGNFPRTGNLIKEGIFSLIFVLKFPRL